MAEDRTRQVVGSHESDDDLDARIAELIERSRGDDPDALDELMPLVYDQLQRIARRLRRRDGLASPTWNTTAIVNEAYLKLARGVPRVVDRGHFFALASTAMRQLLVDEARRRSRAKRGSGQALAPFEEERLPIEPQLDFVLQLDEVLTSLAEHEPRLLKVVECRYFGGLTEEETSLALDVSTRTVRRDWMRARAAIAEAFDESVS